MMPDVLVFSHVSCAGVHSVVSILPAVTSLGHRKTWHLCFCIHASVLAQLHPSSLLPGAGPFAVQCCSSTAIAGSMQLQSLSLDYALPPAAAAPTAAASAPTAAAPTAAAPTAAAAAAATAATTADAAATAAGVLSCCEVCCWHGGASYRVVCRWTRCMVLSHTERGKPQIGLSPHLSSPDNSSSSMSVPPRFMLLCECMLCRACCAVLWMHAVL